MIRSRKKARRARNSSLGRRGEVGVVRPCRVLDGYGNAVIAYASLAVVVGLEVEGGLSEAVAEKRVSPIRGRVKESSLPVRQIMNGIDDVERIGARSVYIYLRCWGSSGVLCKDEVESSRRLRRHSCLRALERDGVVSSSRTGQSGERSKGVNWDIPLTSNWLRLWSATRTEMQEDQQDQPESGIPE